MLSYLLNLISRSALGWGKILNKWLWCYIHKLIKKHKRVFRHTHAHTYIHIDSCVFAIIGKHIYDYIIGYRKGRGTRDQTANICWIVKKAREFQKNIYFCFIDYAKAFDCVDHNKLWKILKEMGIPDHLTCLLRNLYAGQEATVRTGHGTTDWSQIGKGVCQGCILSPCLFNLYAEYIWRRQWHPTPVLLPGKSHGRRSLVGCSPWGC